MRMDQREHMDQHLTFVLGKEMFALDISHVREVLEVAEVTGIPRTPPYMRGVINLRGHAVPVVDMRMKFGMDAISTTVDTCIVIVEVTNGDSSTIMGGMVDGVSEVIELTADMVEPPPRMGAEVDVEFIKSIGRRDDGFIIIIDINKIFSQEELAAAAGVTDEEAA